MSFFLQTLSEISKAFVLFIKGDEKGNEYIQISEAHWLLSWLMVFAGSLIYLMYLPSAFMSIITQEKLPKDATYSDFKSASIISLLFILFAGYFIIYLLDKPLEYMGSVRRYIITQNWAFLVSIVVLLPFSLSLISENSPLISLVIFIFLFILFFAYRALKITLGVNGPKAFMLLLLLLIFELFMDEMINDWFGLVKLTQT